MTAWPIDIVRGATFSLEIDVVDADGNAVDLTGYEAFAELRADARDTAVFATMTAVVTSANPGRVRVSMDPPETAVLEEGARLWWASEARGGPDTIPLLRGPAFVSVESIR